MSETARSVSKQELLEEMTGILAESATMNSIVTTTLLFQLLYLIAQRAVKNMCVKEKQILHINNLPQEAVQTGDKQKWEAHVNDAQKAMEALSNFRNLSDNAQTRAASQESNIKQHEPDPSIYEESTESISEIYKLANACEEIQERVSLVMDEMQADWWKRLAAKKHDNASGACFHAKTTLEKIPPSHNFTNKEKDIADAFQDAGNDF